MLAPVSKRRVAATVNRLLPVFHSDDAYMAGLFLVVGLVATLIQLQLGLTANL